MIPLRFWRSEPQSDALDPELQTLFAARTHAPVIDAARLATGRARVANQLRPAPAPAAATGGWLQQRLAFGFVGGGGVWAALAGTAAAHKAAAAVGVGVLLAGAATTAEVTGIGPAVREAVTSSAPSNDEPALAAATEQAEAAIEASSTPNPNAAVVDDAPEGTPGNLVTQVRPDGSFSLRGILIDATDTQVSVLTSVDDIPLVFDLGDADLRIPGAGGPQGGPNANTEDPSLEDYEGYLVRVTGQCDLVEGALTEDCDLASIQVLGNAGQSEPAEGAGIESESIESESEATGPPDHASNPEGTGPPEGSGKPENPGNSGNQKPSE